MRIAVPILLAFFVARPASARAWADDLWFDPAFLESQALSSGSGFIRVPSPEVLPSGLLCAGLHRYRAKVGRGFLGRLEGGVSVEIEGWKLDDAVRSNLLNAKAALLRPGDLGLGLALAVGADGVGPEDLGAEAVGYVAKGQLKAEERAWAMAGGLLPGLSFVYLALGYVAGNREGSACGALAVSPLPGLLTIAEYDGAGSNLGLRALLSTQIKLDLSLNALQAIDPDKPFAHVLERSIRFGVSYSEAWP